MTEAGPLAVLTSLLPLASFMAVQSITPGPNNILLATAGASAGFRATIPHLLGITAGMSLQVAVLAAGLAPLLRAYPGSLDGLAVAAVAYLVWLAVRIARSPGPAAAPDDASAASLRPMRFVAAAAFQWINPKAWVMSLTVASVLWPCGHSFVDAVLLTTAVTCCVNLPCISVWAATGTLLRRHLQVPAAWLAFKLTMAAGLLLTAAAMAAGR